MENNNFPLDVIVRPRRNIPAPLHPAPKNLLRSSISQRRRSFPPHRLLARRRKLYICTYHVDHLTTARSRPHSTRLNVQCPPAQPSLTFRLRSQSLAHIPPPSTPPAPRPNPLRPQSRRSLRPRRRAITPQLQQRYYRGESDDMEYAVAEGIQ